MSLASSGARARSESTAAHRSRLWSVSRVCGRMSVRMIVVPCELLSAAGSRQIVTSPASYSPCSSGLGAPSSEYWRSTTNAIVRKGSPSVFVMIWKRWVSWETEKRPIPIFPMSRRPDGLRVGSSVSAMPSTAPSLDRFALPPMWWSMRARMVGVIPMPSSSIDSVWNRGRSVLMTTCFASAS